MNKYYPSDLMHGILAAHCFCQMNNNLPSENVKFSLDHYLVKIFQTRLQGKNPLNVSISKIEALEKLNEFLNYWKILKVVQDDDSQYLGIIYSNEKDKNLVLIHRATDFPQSLTYGILGYSTLSIDLQGVLKDTIVPHQILAYCITAEAIELLKSTLKDSNGVNYSQYSFSTAGHSLGGWLAQLSVFYGHHSLSYSNMKAVVFDSPGAQQMIEHLTKGTSRFNIDELDVTTYFSPPNLVNCTNNHIGDKYRLYPDIGKDINYVIKQAQELIKSPYINAGVATIGHQLQYLLQCFDIDSGLPITCDKIQNWPAIIHNRSREQSEYNSIDIAIEYIIQNLPLPFLANTVLRKIIKHSNITEKIALILGTGPRNTFDSVIQLVSDFRKDRIEHDNFLKIQEHLKSHNNYITKADGFSGMFALTYQDCYLNDKYGMAKRPIVDDVDKNLKKLIQNKDKLWLIKENTQLYNKISFLTAQYRYQTLPPEYGKHIEITDELTINEIRDFMRELVHHHLNDYKKFEQDCETHKAIEEFLQYPNTLETKILQFVPFLHRESPIPIKMFKELLSTEENSINAAQLAGVIEELANKKIISSNRDKIDVKASQPILNKIKNKIVNDIQVNLKLELAKTIVNTLPIVTHNNDLWAEANSIANHAIYLLALLPQNESLNNSKFQLNNKLGTFFKYTKSNPNKALQYFLNAIKYISDTPDKKNTLKNIIDICLTLNRLDLTEEYIKKYEKEYNSLPEILRDNFLIKSGQILKAISNINQFLNTNIFDVEKSIAHNNLAFAYIQLEEYHMALKHQIGAFDLVSTTNNSLRAKYLNNLGVINVKLLNPIKALEYLTESLKLKKILYGNDVTQDIASTYENISIVLQQLGKSLTASNYQKKADIIRKELIKDITDHVFLTNCEKARESDFILVKERQKLAEQYTLSGDFVEALEAYKNTLSLLQNYFSTDSNHILLADAFYNVGYAYIQLLDVKSGLESKKEALKIYEEINKNLENVDPAHKTFLERKILICNREIHFGYKRLSSDEAAKYKITDYNFSMENLESYILKEDLKAACDILGELAN